MATLRQFATWDIRVWFVYIGAGLALEILGLVDRHFATFTAITRATLPKWAMTIAIAFLVWHFLFHKR